MKKLLSAFLVISLVLTSGCVISAYSMYEYDDFKKYTAGGGELTDTVESIDISWIDGDIAIVYHDKETVEFYEQSPVDLNERTTMRHYLDGKTLRIKYAAAGRLPTKTFDKTLMLMLPIGTSLDMLNVQSVSSEINVNEIAAKDARIQSVSGNIDLYCAAMQKVNIDLVSGYCNAFLDGQVDDVKINTVSGKIDLRSKSITKCDINGVSANVILVLPESFGFTLDINSVSGDLESDLSFTMHDGKYVYGRGENSFSVNTVSGDISIKKLAEE